MHYQGVPFYEQAENSWEKKRRMEKLRRDLTAESLSKKFPGLILAGKSVAERSSVALLTPPAEIEFLRCHGSKGQTLGETVVHRLGAGGSPERGASVFGVQPSHGVAGYCPVARCTGSGSCDG